MLPARYDLLRLWNVWDDMRRGACEPNRRSLRLQARRGEANVDNSTERPHLGRLCVNWLHPDGRESDGKDCARPALSLRLA